MPKIEHSSENDKGSLAELINYYVTKFNAIL